MGCVPGFRTRLSCSLLAGPYRVGAEKFSGLYDNTGIFTRTMDAMGLTADAE